MEFLVKIIKIVNGKYYLFYWKEIILFQLWNLTSLKFHNFFLESFSFTVSLWHFGNKDVTIHNKIKTINRCDFILHDLKQKIWKLYFAFEKIHSKHSKTLLKNFWKHFENILKTFWKHFENILKSFWKQFEILLNTYWNPFEYIFKFFWKHFEIPLKAFWNPFKTF